jgi:WD40 repeat protein
VLSGSEDKTLRLWEFSTGRCLRTFEGHTDQVNSVAISPDGRWVLSGSDDRTLRLWELNWEYEFPGWSDWDEGAKPYLDIFLTLHCPYGPDSISKIGKPSWNDEDFKRLLKELQYRGYGWLKPDGVRKKLEEMTANWQGSPPLSGE